MWECNDGQCTVHKRCCGGLKRGVWTEVEAGKGHMRIAIVGGKEGLDDMEWDEKFVEIVRVKQ